MYFFESNRHCLFVYGNESSAFVNGHTYDFLHVMQNFQKSIWTILHLQKKKLSELKELSGFAENPSYTQESAYKKNSALFAADRDCKNAAVKKRLSEVTEKDYVRLPKRSERQQLQKKTFHLPQFPTTTIGSFPQTKDVKQNRAAFRKGEITEQEYTAFNRKKLRNV